MEEQNEKESNISNTGFSTIIDNGAMHGNGNKCTNGCKHGRV